MRRVLCVAAAAATVAAGAIAAGGGGRAGAATGEPRAAIFPSAVSFGSQRVGTIQQRSVSVENVGDAPLRVSSVTLNDFSGTYSIAFNTCTGTTVQPGGICQFSVQSHPRMPGSRSATVLISDNAGGHSVPVWGSATAQ